MTETVPDYVGRPYQPVHGSLPSSYQWQNLTEDQIRILRERLIASIVQVIVQAVKGVFIPGGGVKDALQQLENLFSDFVDFSETIDLSAEEVIDEIVAAIRDWTGVDLSSPSDLSSTEVIAEIVAAIKEWTGIDLSNPSSLGSLFTIPLSQIGNFNPQLLLDILFDWIELTGDGTTHSWIEHIIPVSPGQVINMSVLVQWQDLIGTGQPVQLDLMLLRDNLLQEIRTIDTIPAGWSTDSIIPILLSGSYTIPAGINQVVPKLTVTDELDSGTVQFKQASTTKTGLLQQDWVSGLRQNFEDILGNGAGSSGTEFPHEFPVGFGEQSDLARMFSNLRSIFPDMDLLDPVFNFAIATETWVRNALIPTGLIAALDTTGRLLNEQAPQIVADIVAAMEKAFEDNPIVDAVTDLEQNVWDIINGLLSRGNDAQQTANNNATTLTSLTAKVNTVGLGGTPISISETFASDESDNLPAPWDVSYTPSGTGMTLGLDGDGHTSWHNQTITQVVAVGRYPTALASDTQYVSWVLQAKQSNVPGPSEAYGGGCGRMNAARTDYVTGYILGGGGYLGNSPSSARVGFVLGGSFTELGRKDVFTTAGDVWELFIGTVASAREFVLKQNGTLILQRTDTGATSAMDASHLFTGLIQATGHGTNAFLSPVLNLPAPLNGFASSDRAA